MALQVFHHSVILSLYVLDSFIHLGALRLLFGQPRLTYCRLGLCTAFFFVVGYLFFSMRQQFIVVIMRIERWEPSFVEGWFIGGGLISGHGLNYAGEPVGQGDTYSGQVGLIGIQGR